WLASPDVASYLGIQALTGGVVALLAPLELVAALPLLALNGLSSFDWMRSGGAHYSALLVPLLLWAGMHGAARIGRPIATGGVVLVSVLAAHLWIGASPLDASDPDPRAGVVLGELRAVPGDVAVSASSALYPHMADRHRLYWFPARQDADWVAVDVAGTSHPLDPAEMRDTVIDLLATGDWGGGAARDGLLVPHQAQRGRL